MDRAHRLGQRRTVNVYRVLTRGTLEEKIMGLQRFKLDVAAAVVNSDNVSLSAMDTSKLLDLFAVQVRTWPLSARVGWSPLNRYVRPIQLGHGEADIYPIRRCSGPIALKARCNPVAKPEHVAVAHAADPNPWHRLMPSRRAAERRRRRRAAQRATRPSRPLLPSPAERAVSRWRTPAMMHRSYMTSDCSPADVQLALTMPCHLAPGTLLQDTPTEA